MTTETLTSLEAHAAGTAADVGLVFEALAAAVNWRYAVDRADIALAHAADVHQGIEPGSTKAEHRKVTALEIEVRERRDAFDGALQRFMRHRGVEMIGLNVSSNGRLGPT